MGTEAKPWFTDHERLAWKLMGDGLTTYEIVERMDLPRREAFDIVHDLIDRYGSPNVEAAREAIARLQAIRF